MINKDKKDFIFDSDPVIFTTGAFLQPLKIIDSDGKEIWVWYVSEYVDDTFKDGEVYNPKEFASSKEKLMIE